MVVPGPHLYDDPTSRTRMAWGRTVLAVVVVTFLVARGLVLRGAPVVLVVLAVGLGVVVAGSALARMRWLVQHRDRMRAGTLVGVVGGLAGLLVMAAAGWVLA